MALAAIAAIVAVIPSGGCKRSPRVVPVKGRVLYNGQPLPFGTVMFQPDKGQPAAGELAADGTFTLSSYAANDGAVPGKHLVSVKCFEGQRPGRQAPGDTSLGKLLIPLKYSRFGSSELSVDINDTPGDTAQEVVFELTGPAVKFN